MNDEYSQYRSCSVKAVTKCEIFSLSNKDLMSIFRPYPQVIYKSQLLSIVINYDSVSNLVFKVLAHIEAIAAEKYHALQAMNPSTFISGNESVVDMHWQLPQQ